MRLSSGFRLVKRSLAMTLADCADGDLSIDNSCNHYVPLGAAFRFIKYSYDPHRQSHALNVAELHLLMMFFFFF